MEARLIHLDDYLTATRKGALVPRGPISHNTGHVSVTHATTGRTELLHVDGYAHTGVPYVAKNGHANMVLVYSVGTSVTHYVGLDGCQLSVMREHTAQFEAEYQPATKYTPDHFARAYLNRAPNSLRIPVSGAAFSVLRAILAGRADGLLDPATQPEHIMTQATEGTRRNPEGPVASIHKFLDGKLDGIKAQTISRKELIDAMEAKGYNKSTIVTQCGVWARTNGVTFARPTQAAAVKKEAAAEKRAAKKAGAPTAPAKKAAKKAAAN